MYEQTMNLFILKSLPAFNFDYKMRLKEYDLNEIIKDLEKTLPEQMNEDVKVKIDLADRELKIMADLLRIKEAFLNLIKNANDAMPSGGILTLSSKQAFFRDESMNIDNNYLSGASVLLSVSDTGTGMDEQTQEKIYEPFFTTKEGVGRGLGFPVASYIIQSHGGSINVDSTPGIGTKINIYLPLLKDDFLQPSPIPLPSSFVKQSSNGYRNTLLMGYLGETSESEKHVL
jgi:signal transduction histidine kinase